MAVVNGCNLPEDVHYYIDKHVWARPLDGTTVRVGMTSVAAKLSGGKLAAITIKRKAVGSEVEKGKSIGTIESSKYVGPVPAAINGTLVRGNGALVDDPNLAVADPYGAGWIAEMTTSDWETEAAGLVTGEKGVAAYRAWLEAEGVSCD
jgi:glycine cleavage system H protein